MHFRIVDLQGDLLSEPRKTVWGVIRILAALMQTSKSQGADQGGKRKRRWRGYVTNAVATASLMLLDATQRTTTDYLRTLAKGRLRDWKFLRAERDLGQS